MARMTRKIARLALLSSALLAATAQAQDSPYLHEPSLPPTGPQLWPGYDEPNTLAQPTAQPISQAGTPLTPPAPVGGGVGFVAVPPASVAAAAAIGHQPGYVRLNAPLYPCPQPNVPIWTGGTVITNQALAPHEMLYPHTYRALYPPYYHRVKGHWFWTPFGMRSHEEWQLQGTLVEVKYRSHYPLTPKFFPPHTSLYKYPQEIYD